ncbi:hypothetical protein [Sphingopyxis terrae]|uniref:hypothetical protein n=1 Tax=Sphingopyxis terrae TaxID=33052 RepID=UPI0036302E20
MSDQLFGGTAQRVSASAPSAIAQLLFEDHSGQWVAALSAASVNLEATLMGQEADFKFQPWIASVQYKPGALEPDRRIRTAPAVPKR